MEQRAAGAGYRSQRECVRSGDRERLEIRFGWVLARRLGDQERILRRVPSLKVVRSQERIGPPLPNWRTVE